jgi:hypothetical protein
VLIFDSYSALHDLANPEADVLGGVSGVGYKGEFQFVVRSISGDEKTIELSGLKRGAASQLVRCDSLEDIFLERARTLATRFTSNGARWAMAVNGQSVPTTFLSIDDKRRVFSLLYKDGDLVEVQDGYYNFSHLGVDFHHPVSVTANGATVTFDGLRPDFLTSVQIFYASRGNVRDEALSFTSVKNYVPVDSSAMADYNVVDDGVNLLEVFKYQRGLDIYKMPKQVTLKITTMSPGVEKWRKSFKGKHSNFDNFQLLMPRGTYDFAVAVHYTNGGYWYWQAPGGEKAFNPMKDQEENASNNKVTLNLSYGTTNNSIPAGYNATGDGSTDFRNFLQQPEGFTIIEGSGAFWFRSNKDKSYWFKTEK